MVLHIEVLEKKFPSDTGLHGVRIPFAEQFCICHGLWLVPTTEENEREEEKSECPDQNR